MKSECDLDMWDVNTLGFIFCAWPLLQYVISADADTRPLSVCECVQCVVQSPSGPLPGARLTIATPSPMSIRCTCYCVGRGPRGRSCSLPVVVVE
jgi:hypothetical protein